MRIFLSKAFSKDTYHIYIMCLTAAAWGIGIVMSKEGLKYLPPLELLLIQLTSSLTLLWFITLSSNQSRKLLISLIFQPKKILIFALPGLAEPGLSYSLGSIGLTMTTASNSSLISSTEPVMTVVIAWLLLREKVSLNLIALSAVAIFGVILTLGFDINFNVTSLTGDVLVVSGIFCAALYGVLSSKSAKRVPPILLAAFQQTFGLMWIFLFCLWQRNEITNFINIPFYVWILAISSGIVHFTIPFCLYLTALKTIPVSIAAQFLTLIPLFGTSAAYIFLGERLTIIQGLGMLVTILAILGIARLHTSD